MYLLYLLAVIIFLVFLAVRKKTKAIEIETIHREREKFNAPKILYLRAFNVDGDDAGNSTIEKMNLLSKELNLADSLISLGHYLIAVGKPDEDVPQIGFDRKKFTNDTWQTEVLSLMKESNLIIYRPDTSSGVLWEIEKILELDYRSKLVIWADLGFGDMKEIQKARYNVFRRKIFEQYSEQIPQYDKSKKFMVSNSKNIWDLYYWINQTPIYKELAKLRSAKL